MITAVIPCYKVADHILPLLAGIGPEVTRIICVDDACPEGSGSVIEQGCRDARVSALRHAQNRGVGGAMVTGFAAALEGGARVVVKLDGDGQMDPALIAALAAPVLAGQADYAKGNRFFSPETVRGMPAIRLAGNAVLSFMTKLSTGYWSVFDPTNGFLAIDAGVLRLLPCDKLAPRYFFESDMLFRLSVLRAVVVDVPMQARYGEEASSLRIGRVIGPFLAGHARNFAKRIVYGYFLRDFHIASLELVLGLAATMFGVLTGTADWIHSAHLGRATPAGAVMLAALPLALGVQLLLAFLNFDITAEPQRPIQHSLRSLQVTGVA